MNQFTEALKNLNMSFEIIEFPSSTRTAVEAATALGIEVGQIAKSIIFKISGEDNAVLVVTSGSNRVDTKKVEEIISKKVEKAGADFVKEFTGYTIGGVAPIGHLHLPIILLDQDLKQYEIISAAAGANNKVFKLTPTQLQQMTKAKSFNIKEERQDTNE